MGLFSRVAGIAGSFFQLGGPSAAGIQSNGSAIEARNSGNTGFVVSRAADPVAANDLVTLEYLNANVSTNINLLLAADPVSTCTYSATYSGNSVTQEAWNATTGGTPLVKKVTYAYTGSRVTTEVRYVYASDGVTVVGQLTIVYSYTGNKLTSATYTRNV